MFLNIEKSREEDYLRRRLRTFLGMVGEYGL